MIGRTDDLTGASVNISLEHERVHAGREFQASYKTPDGSQVADDDALDMLIITGSTPVHFIFKATAGGNHEVLFYENTTVSNNGTTVPVVGMNRHRSIAPKVTAWHTPTVTTVGDQLFNSWDALGTGLTTPEARDGTEWVLKADTNYLIRSINRAGGARDMAIIAQWYQALGGE